jgi:hypothetical protein
MTACSAGHSSAQPDVVVYSKETQKKALNELKNNNVPTLKEFMKDYKVMRDQVRVVK